MRVTFMMSLSDELKEAIQTYAQQHDMSTSTLLREAVSKRIGYDLQADEQHQAETRIDRRGRPRIYETPEARKAAQRERNKTKYAQAKAILQQFEAQVAERDRQALRDSLKSD